MSLKSGLGVVNTIEKCADR